MKNKHFDDLTKLGNNVALGVKQDDECVDLIMVKFYESSGYLIVCTNLHAQWDTLFWCLTNFL